MKKFLLLIILLIINTRTLAKEQITNLITPVSYFVNHEQQLKILEKHLNKYRQASIVGTSGIGKTQLIRMYGYENKNNYDLIWFFDCNLDFNEQFVRLAKQLNIVKQTNISEEIALAKKEVISYLTSTNKWLLVFDNLKVNENKKVQDLIDWEHNGNIVFCSQDNEKLSNIIAMPILDKPTIIALANSLLDNKDNNSVEFLTQSFSGYPILIVQGTQLLNKIKGLDKEEYKKKIYQSTDKIATNISMAIQELKPSAVNLLNKIALINNQSFSKQLLTIITDHKDSLDDDIYQLSKFMLINNINPSEDNPIFEMHDIVSNKIMELNGNKRNKIYLENIITKLPKSKTRHLQYAWMTANTILGNLTTLLNNSEKYNIDLYAMLDLRCILSAVYINSHNFYKAKQMVDWFEQKDKNKEFKLHKMSEYQKYRYVKYLNVMAVYNVLLTNYEETISYSTRALNILEKLSDDDSFLKFTLISNIIGSQASLGNIEITEQYIKQIDQLRGINESDIHIIYSLKGYLYFLHGKYNEALHYYNKNIEIYIKNGTPPNSPYLTSSYLNKVEMLNYLGRYQEAYDQIRQLYDMQKSIQKGSYVFSRIYTQMAKSELGLGKIDKASKHINKAMAIFSTNEYKKAETVNYLQDLDLAESYVVQGDILFAQNNIKQAIESYKQAFTIYHYLYKDKSKNIAPVSNLYNHAAKAACKSKDLYNYKFFGKPQIKEFGIHHPNTVDMFEYCKQYNMDLWIKNH
ncbi:tetratricopeptide repeat protein [Candidatus Tisiphia endosymbiont of Nedyus quadrimaculatus]|uniref:tetratricopeptide repeat protein n=1 Tax=Candidatus Tisiphia endosymbiont of Nedyus quadrimaculatus TaxID=3139332 RepID=UPI00345E70CE